MAAPTESSRFWTAPAGAGDGASAYTRDQLAEAFRNMLLGDATLQGPLVGLAVSGASSPMTLAVGAACVYGYMYFCTVAGDVTKSTPAVGTTGFRVVLRADWTAQTVRVAVVSSADGVSAIPAVTQTAGTTWEITLATGTITTGGVVTLTDARAFAVAGPVNAALSVLGRSANTVGALAPIVAANDNEVLRRSGTSIGFGTVATAGIADDAVTTAKIADSQVTAAKIANRTRTFLVDVQAVDSTGGTTINSGYGIEMLNSEDTYVRAHFKLPSDYASGLVVTPVIIGPSSGTANNVTLASAVYAGADGEDWNTHSASVSATAVATPGNNDIKVCSTVACDLSASAAAGDYITCTYERNGSAGGDTFTGTVYAVGFLVSYTADS